MICRPSGHHQLPTIAPGPDCDPGSADHYGPPPARRWSPRFARQLWCDPTARTAPAGRPGWRHPRRPATGPARCRAEPPRLAPLYDVSSVLAWPHVVKAFAQNIVGKNRTADGIAGRHWEAIASEIGYRPTDVRNDPFADGPAEHVRGAV